jgi:hypothetical protein
MELKNSSLLGFYALRMNCQESPKRFGMRLATGHKMKTETWIEEPSILMDSWDMISAREPIKIGNRILMDFSLIENSV